MSKYMPSGGFEWVKPSLEGLNDLNLAYRSDLRGGCSLSKRTTRSP